MRDLIVERIESKEYDAKIKLVKDKKHREGYVFDENKSVKWNKEEVVKHNQKVDEACQEYRNQRNEGINKFQFDVKQLILEIFSFDVSQELIQKIYNRAWGTDHSEGLRAVVYEAVDLAEFINELMESQKEYESK